MASYSGHIDVVRWLVSELGCDATAERNHNGWTALLWACDGGRLDVARYLVAEAGSDVTFERNKVTTASARMLTVLSSL
jgi:ankyrin repeat protein